MGKTSAKVKAICGVFIFACGMFVDAKLAQGDFRQLLQSGNFTSAAFAIVGRPLTPLSVAGVARRTTRRVVRRTAVYATTLPRNCVTVQINGVASWQCGSTYYQQSGTQYVVINVNSN